jgi:hypothetical protein
MKLLDGASEMGSAGAPSGGLDEIRTGREILRGETVEQVKAKLAARQARKAERKAKRQATREYRQRGSR